MQREREGGIQTGDGAVPDNISPERNQRPGGGARIVLIASLQRLEGVADLLGGGVHSAIAGDVCGPPRVQQLRVNQLRAVDRTKTTCRRIPFEPISGPTRSS